MKTIKLNGLTKWIYSIMIISLSSFMLQCCVTKHAFQTSSVVPAAEGSVKVKKDKNNNYNIELSIIRLADPKRLNPAKDVYVVWMETDQKQIKNLGQLKTSSSLLSKTLKSSLKAVTPFKPYRIFITAEDNAAIQNPSGQEILNTSNF